MLIAGVLVLPVAIEAPGPEGGSATSVSAAAGAGSLALVARGCEGRVLRADKLQLRDAAAAVEHHFPGPVSVGVRAGVTDIRELSYVTRYVNPHASLDWTYAGLGGGYIYSNQTIYTGGELGFETDQHNFGSGHLRVGRADRIYLLMSVAEGMPLYSDGGLFELGIGFKPHSRVQALATLSALPYDAAGLGLHARIETTPNLYLDLGGRLGGSEGVAENAWKVGVTYRATHGSGSQ
jgi:hypothetical protein